jgi:hypothetical protein
LNHTPLSSLPLLALPSANFDHSSTRITRIDSAMGGLSSEPYRNQNPFAVISFEPLVNWEQSFIAPLWNYSEASDAPWGFWEQFGPARGGVGVPQEQTAADLRPELLRYEMIPVRTELVSPLADLDVAGRTEYVSRYSEVAFLPMSMPAKTVMFSFSDLYPQLSDNYGTSAQTPLTVWWPGQEFRPQRGEGPQQEETVSTYPGTAGVSPPPTVGPTLLVGPGRPSVQTALLSTSSVISGPPANFAALAVTDLRAAGNRLPGLPILVVAGSFKPDNPLSGSSLSATTAHPSDIQVERSLHAAGQDEAAAKASPTKAQAVHSSASLPLPEVAGLVTEALYSGMATLEHAIQTMLQPEPEAETSGASLLYWVGLSTGMVASVLAYRMVCHRRGTHSAVAGGTQSATGSRAWGEDLS